MGRPKGSKNKSSGGVQAEQADQPKHTDDEPDDEPDYEPEQYSYSPDEPIAEPAPLPEKPAAKPDPVTITLTDEDLEPVRNSKAKHDRAAAKYRRDEIQAELRRKEIGEVEELSVPQVVAFDMSAAFYRVAQQKARAAGYRFAHNLRKTPEGWVFNASNFPKVKHAPEADLS